MICSLSKNSSKLIELLKKYDSKNFKVDKITNNIFFMKLYSDIKNIINEHVLGNIEIKRVTEDPFFYFKDNSFTSSNIKNKIKIELKYGYQFTNNNNIIIYYTKKEITKIPLIIENMFLIINTLKKLFNRNFFQRVIFFETLEKKEFPQKDNLILGSNEVNTGLTINNDFNNHSHNGDIILYRKEELLKVLIHELIHSNLIDRKIIKSDSVTKFSNIFCVNYQILLNEAFTESIALIINLFYIHIKCKFNKKMLNSMFQNEINYSNYICSKILNYYKIDKIGDIIKKDKNCSTIFPQKSNVFSYYFLKNILISNHISYGNILNKYYHERNHYKINNKKCIDKIIELLINNIYLLDKRLYKVSDDKNNSLQLCLYEMKL